MPPDLIPRKSICLGQPLPPNVVIHDRDSNFTAEYGRLYTSTAESNILEELVILKTKLRQCTTDDFWSLVSERMAELLGAQLSFVAKRILVDEQDAAIEMPPIGEPGSCLMASAWYYNDGNGLKGIEKGFKYHAYGCPCGYMRHDKVFVVPEKVSEIFGNNPNKLPVSAEAYIGIPLFADKKCIAHFGVIWSVEGAAKRNLSWAYIELFLHSLEDIILERLLEGSTFKNSDSAATRDPPRIIPHEVITAAQSLQPYAKSLSHELRTPMQGVVGMLDVMYATVQEATEGQTDPEIRQVFETLKENIETVQDSSRRAVEAADNVVHAYDMNLGIPQGPPLPVDDTMDGVNTEALHAHHPDILVAGSDLPIIRPNKRRREENKNQPEGSPSKVQATLAARASKASPTQGMKEGVFEAEELPPRPQRPTMPQSPRPSIAPLQGERAIAPGIRHTNLRRVLQYVVNEGLKVGGRPESAIAQETSLGEIIEVCTRSANGDPRTKLIEWSVDAGVPETMLVDEKDLAKLVSCVFLNAIKFTEQGNITVTAKLSPKHRYIVIKCTDTGPGIPAAFLPRLFQPFSQEDPSLTRQSEGLGLGLLVAKGLARKLGGDLFCLRADTTGPKRGSEFEMRIPLKAGEVASRPSSPFDTPYNNRARQSNSIDSDGRPSPIPLGAHGRSWSDSSNKSQPSPTSGPTDPPAPAVQSPRPIAPTPPVFPMPSLPARQPSISGRKSSASMNGIDRNLATKYPLTFLVAEDNKINRKLLVSMLTKFGYKTIHEAYDGAEAVRQMTKNPAVDVVLMDLWMPFMDGYEATEKILAMPHGKNGVCGKPTVLAVTADVTDGALERAAKVGMKGFMTKPFKLMDLQRLILEYCARSGSESVDGE